MSLFKGIVLTVSGKPKVLTHLMSSPLFHMFHAVLIMKFNAGFLCFTSPVHIDMLHKRTRKQSSKFPDAIFSIFDLKQDKIIEYSNGKKNIDGK